VSAPDPPTPVPVPAPAPAPAPAPKPLTAEEAVALLADRYRLLFAPDQVVEVPDLDHLVGAASGRTPRPGSSTPPTSRTWPGPPSR
jgi:hypothetical protein